MNVKVTAHQSKNDRMADMLQELINVTYDEEMDFKILKEAHLKGHVSSVFIRDLIKEKMRKLREEQGE